MLQNILRNVRMVKELEKEEKKEYTNLQCVKRERIESQEESLWQRIENAAVHPVVQKQAVRDVQVMVVHQKVS